MPANVFFYIERSWRWGADDVGVVCVLCMRLRLVLQESFLASSSRA